MAGLAVGERGGGLPPGPRVAGIGWATVELDRAAAELASAIGLAGPDAFRAGAGEPFLGAACRLASPPGGPPVLILEPTTEGRLAAHLARHGEGVAAVYVAMPRGHTATQLQHGPLGPQQWLAGDRDGPWVIAVSTG